MNNVNGFLFDELIITIIMRDGSELLCVLSVAIYFAGLLLIKYAYSAPTGN